MPCRLPCDRGRWLTGTVPELVTRPVETIPARDEDLQTGEPAMAHIVKTEPDESAAAKVLEARIYGTPIEALCGHVWVPSRPQAAPAVPEVQGDLRGLPGVQRGPERPSRRRLTVTRPDRHTPDPQTPDGRPADAWTSHHLQVGGGDLVRVEAAVDPHGVGTLAAPGGMPKPWTTVPSGWSSRRSRLDDGPSTEMLAWISPLAERPQPQAVRVAPPPGRAGLVTDTPACGAAPPMTLTGVVGTFVREPVQIRLATYAPGARSGVWKVTATVPSGRTADGAPHCPQLDDVVGSGGPDLHAARRDALDHSRCPSPRRCRRTRSGLPPRSPVCRVAESVRTLFRRPEPGSHPKSP